MAAKIGNIFVKLGLDTATFNQKLGQVNKRFGKAVGRIKRDARGLSSMSNLGGGLVAGMGLRSVIEANQEFSKSINGIRAVLQPTEAEFAKLESQALKLGKTTKFTAIESASAIEVLGKNGLKTSEILGGALDASLTLSASTGAGLAESADVATDAMLIFGKTAGQLKGVVNDVNGVIINSKFGFEDYKNALAAGGPAATKAGEKLDEFNSTIAATASFFASGETAGTAYKVFLDRIVGSSDKAKLAMKQMGLTMFDAKGQFVGMASVAEQLKTSTQGLNEEARITLLSDIFGTRASNFAIALSKVGKAGIESKAGLIAQADAAVQADIRMQGLDGAMLRLSSAVEGLKLAFAPLLNDYFVPFVQKATEAVVVLSELPGWVMATAAAFAGLMVVIPIFGMIVGGIITTTGYVFSMARGVLTASKFIAKALLVLTKGFLRAAKAAAIMASRILVAIAPVLIPIAAITAALAGIGFMIAAVSGQFEDVNGWTENLSWTEKISRALTATWQALKAGAYALVAGIAEIARIVVSSGRHASDMGQMFEIAFSLVKNSVLSAVNWVLKGVNKMIGGALKGVNKMIDGLNSIPILDLKIGKLNTNALDIKEFELDTIKGFKKTGVGASEAFLAGVRDNAAAESAKAVKGISQALNGELEAPAIIQSIKKTFTFDSPSAELSTGLGEGSEGIAEIEAMRLAELKKELAGLKKELAGLKKELTGLGATGETSLGGVSSGASGAIPKIKSMGEVAKVSTKKLVESTKESADQMKEIWNSATSNMSTAFNNLIDNGKLGFTDMVSSIAKDIAKLTIKTALKNGLSGDGSLGGILGGIGSFFGVAGARAEGGNVNSGSTYLVGERGAELFTPNRSGAIVPNDKLGAGGGGGGTTIHEHYNLQPGVSQAELQTTLQEFARVRDEARRSQIETGENVYLGLSEA